jgi:hypothetical protein
MFASAGGLPSAGDRGNAATRGRASMLARSRCSVSAPCDELDRGAARRGECGDAVGRDRRDAALEEALEEALDVAAPPLGAAPPANA